MSYEKAAKPPHAQPHHACHCHWPHSAPTPFFLRHTRTELRYQENILLRAQHISMSFRFSVEDFHFFHYLAISKSRKSHHMQKMDIGAEIMLKVARVISFSNNIYRSEFLFQFPGVDQHLSTHDAVYIALSNKCEARSFCKRAQNERHT